LQTWQGKNVSQVLLEDYRLTSGAPPAILKQIGQLRRIVALCRLF
jgi:hypothetical protein